jgi:hypothetical protein
MRGVACIAFSIQASCQRHESAEMIMPQWFTARLRRRVNRCVCSATPQDAEILCIRRTSRQRSQKVGNHHRRSLTCACPQCVPMCRSIAQLPSGALDICRFPDYSIISC